MFLSHLSLQHFRSYPMRDFHFDDGLTVIVGENGKGKTNILEAIYSLATIKPFRNAKREVFMEHGALWTRIAGTVQLENGTAEQLDLFWDAGKKFQAKHNDIQSTSVKEFLAEKSFLAVLFAPEDLFLPFLSPSYRRTVLSRILSPLFPEYFFTALQYEKTLRNRNALLKRKKDGEPVVMQEFIFWDRELCRLHEILYHSHVDFFHFINTHISALYSAIAGKDEEVILVPVFSAPDGLLPDLLHAEFSKDIARGSTSSGVHRDDFFFTLRGYPLSEDASRGEIRSVILAFKKAEQMFLEYNTHKTPILLLDDVFSELDLNHQTHLLQSMHSTQCIITTTEMHVAMNGGIVEIV